MTAYSRQGNKWTINEMLSLQREYELLELSVQQIAEKHQRSEASILYKLESEGLIDSWNNARGFDSVNYQKNVSCINEDELDDEVIVGGDDDDDEDYQFEENEDEYEDEDITDDESDVEKLTERVWSLETSVSEISSMVKNIFSLLTTKQSSKKRKPLRTQSSSA
jgi:hypothetical protein